MWHKYFKGPSGYLFFSVMLQEFQLVVTMMSLYHCSNHNNIVFGALNAVTIYNNHVMLNMFH